MERFSPEQRDCYTEDEISLKYLPRDHGYRYEMSNCLFEAAFENILEVRGTGKIMLCCLMMTNALYYLRKVIQ